MAELYVRAPDLAIRWREDGELLCTAANNGRDVIVPQSLCAALMAARQPTSLEALAVGAKLPVSILAAAVDAGVLVTEAEAQARKLPPYWDLFEALVQCRAWHGQRRQQPLSRVADASSGARPAYELGPFAERGPEVSFASVLRTRRSRRAFGDHPLPLSTLATWMCATLAVTDWDTNVSDRYRPHPSAGGCYPIRIYVGVLAVAGLRPGVYAFDPCTQSLAAMSAAEDALGLLQELVTDAAAGKVTGCPSVILVLTAAYEATMTRYRHLGLLLIHKDAGALLQTVHLQAEAQGLVGFAIGGGPGHRLARALGLVGLTEGYVAGFALGTAP